VQGTGFFALQRGLVLTNARVATPDNAVAGKVRVILNSGTRSERSFPAEVIASDSEMYLAVLRVSGQNLPEPLLLSPAATLLETTPLYLFGFPFGDGLAARGCNPEPSVLRASVSCLRHTPEGGVDVIQLDSELHPGNSGGPVVDVFGRVVGITVSRLRSTRIGFAIPGERVIRLLEKQTRAARGAARQAFRGKTTPTAGTRRRLEGPIRSRKAR
jgi:serine protease Do